MQVFNMDLWERMRDCVYLRAGVYPHIHLIALAVTKSVYFLRLVCQYARTTAAPNGLISVKFYNGTSMKICLKNPNLVEIGHKYRRALREDLCKFYCCGRH